MFLAQDAWPFHASANVSCRLGMQIQKEKDFSQANPSLPNIACQAMSSSNLEISIEKFENWRHECMRVK